MSQENVELARRAYDAYRGGDLAEALRNLDPNVEWYTPPGERELDLDPVYRGPDGVATGIKAWADSWENYEANPVEFIDAGDQVVVVLHQRGRGKGSGAVVERTHFHVITVRGGKGVRIREFRQRTDALEAAGLSE